MLKFLINLFKLNKKKENRMVRKYYRDFLTYTYRDDDNRTITKTIQDVEIVIKETAYGKSCNVICKDNLTREEIIAIIGMFV